VCNSDYSTAIIDELNVTLQMDALMARDELTIYRIYTNAYNTKFARYILFPLIIATIVYFSMTLYDGYIYPTRINSKIKESICGLNRYTIADYSHEIVNDTIIINSKITSANGWVYVFSSLKNYTNQDTTNAYTHIICKNETCPRQVICNSATIARNEVLTFPANEKIEFSNGGYTSAIFLLVILFVIGVCFPCCRRMTI
jgi:hypothetical protein